MFLYASACVEPNISVRRSHCVGQRQSLRYFFVTAHIHVHTYDPDLEIFAIALSRGIQFDTLATVPTYICVNESSDAAYIRRMFKKQPNN